MRMCTKDKQFKIFCRSKCIDIEPDKITRETPFKYTSNGVVWFDGFLTREMFWIFGDSFIECI